MKKFWQITEFGNQGERDWFVQADSGVEATGMLTTLICWNEKRELLFIREVPPEEIGKMFNYPEDLAFTCINS